MQRPGSHERALAAFRAGKVRILLGTQMIAKGLDFPNVTLVGVVNADTALHLPDFRAAERTFQLVTQVAGRTGRGEKGGRVLVQTFNPDHPAILAAVRHDYAAFAAGELPMRKMFSYPPFVEHGPPGGPRAGRKRDGREFAGQLAERLSAALVADGGPGPGPGPAPAPFASSAASTASRSKSKAPTATAPRVRGPQATRQLKPPEDVQWIVDVDPLDML